MDYIKKDDKKLWAKKKIPFLIFLIISTFIIIILNLYKPSIYKVNASNLMIGVVKRGDMSVKVRGNGVFAPKNIRWISANVDGFVDNIFLKQGNLVKKGDIIVKLINPELIQKNYELQWELEAVEAEKKAMEAKLQSEMLDQEIVILTAKHNYESSKERLVAEEILYNRNNGSVSVLDYKKSKLDTKQFHQLWRIEKNRIKKIKVTHDARLEANYARVNKMKKEFSRSEQMINSLIVKSNYSGVIQNIDLEVGQRVNIGYNIAKIARQDELIAQIKIPERQIRNVSIGSSVIINTHINSIVGQVERIDPSVIDGTVQVDVTFTDPLPNEARPDLSIEGSIEVTKINNTIYVKRPLFSQSETQSIVYKISEDGKKAIKTKVKFGIGSSEYIQIISGLNTKEKIIISDHSTWKGIDNIKIENSRK